MGAALAEEVLGWVVTEGLVTLAMAAAVESGVRALDLAVAVESGAEALDSAAEGSVGAEEAEAWVGWGAPVVAPSTAPQRC